MPAVSQILICLIGLFSVLSLVLQGTPRRRAREALLAAATALVALFYGTVLFGKSSMTQMKAAVTAEKAELPLKFQSTFNVGVARIYSHFFKIEDSEGKRKTPLDLSTTGMNSMMRTAARYLEQSVESSPEPELTRAKLVVVYGVAQLKEPQDLKEICRQLAEKEPYKQLAKALEAAFVARRVSSQLVDSYEAALKKHLPVGWYRDYALLSLYRSAPDQAEYARYGLRLEEQYWQTFIRFFAGVLLGIVALFVGLVALVVQVGSLGRERWARTKGPAQTVAETEKPSLAIDLKTVFSVFIAWQCTQVMAGHLLRLLPKGMLHLNKDPLGLAMFVFLTYLVNMLPAVLFIYFLALKPHGLGFVEGLKIRLRTSSSGPGRIILTGVFSWCAAIPMVLGTFIVASQFLGSQGSDNPILAQIISAATTSNVPAILLLLVTIAVLAPVFEEIVFRGFLYASLRDKIGVFPAVLASSLVFACIHLDKGGVAMLFGIGFVLAVSFERSRSLVAPIVAHCMWNGGTFLLNLALMAN